MLEIAGKEAPGAVIADGHIAQKQVLDAVKFHADDQRVAGDIQIGIVRAAELIQGIIHGNVVRLSCRIVIIRTADQ